MSAFGWHVPVLKRSQAMAIQCYVGRNYSVQIFVGTTYLLKSNIANKFYNQLE